MPAIPKTMANGAIRCSTLPPRWLRDVLGEMGDFNAQLLQHLPRHTPPQHLHTRLSDLNRCLFGHAPVQDKEAALLLFVGDLFRSASTRRSQPQPNMARLRSVQAMIQARCAEALTLDEMAAQAGMSRYHFVRSFKRAVGLLWDWGLARAAGHPPVVKRFMTHVRQVERTTGVILLGLAAGIAWSR